MRVPWVMLAAAATLGTAFAGEAHGGQGKGVEAKSDEVKTAERYANDAYEAYQEKDFATAVALYLKALEAAPSADITYNIAKIYDTKLKDRQLAMTFYRRYIADPGATSERVTKANERLAELREAEIAANSSAEPAPTSAPATAGPATAAPAAQPEPAPASPPAAGGADDGLTAVQITGLVVGVAGLAGLGLGTGFGVAAMASADDANAVCDGNACTSQEGVDATESARSKATVSTIGFVAGGTLLASGLMMLVFGSSSSDRTGGDTAALRWEPAFGPQGGGLQLTGRW